MKEMLEMVGIVTQPIETNVFFFFSFKNIGGLPNASLIVLAVESSANSGPAEALLNWSGQTRP